MRSLHGHGHHCVVVADAVRDGKFVHVLMVDGAPVWTLLEYFRARNFDFSTEAVYAHAAGLLIDFIAARADVYKRPADRAEFLNAFAYGILHGTIRAEADATGLWWHARSTARARRLVFVACEISDYLHARFAAVALNPFNRPASVAERIAFWRRWNSEKSNSLLKHVKSKGDVDAAAKVARAVSVPGRKPAVSGAPPCFPETQIQRLLFDGFTRAGGWKQLQAWHRWNIRDILITLLLHFGGLRMSEPMHLWADDVFVDPANPQSAMVLVHHPHDGIYEHLDPFTGRKVRSCRGDYLRTRYNRQPLNEMIGQQHAGWKNSLLTQRDRKAFEVFWFPRSMGELFLTLYRIYLQQVRPVSTLHPYLFITQNGEPLGTAQFAKNHARAVRRTGLTPTKGEGTSTHGHRHAYGQRLSKAGLTRKEIQMAMHHVSPFSQDVYTEPSASDVWSAIKEAESKLAIAGFMFDLPPSFTPD